MGLLNTLYLAGITLVIVPIILHLWRRRTGIIIDFPPIKYLIRAQQRFRKNIVFSDIFLMILRMLVIIFLTIAMSQPYTGSPFVKSNKNLENTAILIDTSMSMCVDGYIKRAKRVASEIKNSHKEPVFVVTFNDSVESFSKSERSDKIIDELKCSYKGTDIYTAISNTTDMIGEGEKFIYLITDMTENGWEIEKIGALLEEKDLNLIIVDVTDGLKPQNYFIRDFRTEEIPEGTKIHFRVDSTSESDKEIPVSLNLDNSTKLRAFTHPGEEVEFTIQSGSSESGFIELSGDELKEDNRYFFFLDIKKKSKILVVDGEPDIRPFRGESYFLLRAISALKEKFRSDITVVTPSALSDSQAFNHNIFFLLNVPQLQKRVIDRIMEEVNKGAGLFLTSGNNTDINWFKIMLADRIGIIPERIQEGEFHAGSVMPERGFLDISERDKRLLGDIVFRKRIVFIPAESERAATLLSFSDGSPALIKSIYGSGVVIIFASTLDTDWTNLPLSGVFVPFVHGILMKLSAGGKPSVVKNLLTGEHNIEFSEISEGLTMIAPDGGKRMVKVENEKIRADIDIPGIWHFGNYILTVNTDPQESEMRGLDRYGLQKILGKRLRFYEGKITASNRDAFKPLWQYFIIIFGFFVVIESILSGRKR